MQMFRTRVDALSRLQFEFSQAEHSEFRIEHGAFWYDIGCLSLKTRERGI